VQRVCEAVLGVDAEGFVCVPDGVQHNIIHKALFSAMMSRLIIKMARDDSSYVVGRGCGIQTAINPPSISKNSSVNMDWPGSQHSHMLQ
jgi:hypothetical protein